MRGLFRTALIPAGLLLTLGMPALAAEPSAGQERAPTGPLFAPPDAGSSQSESRMLELLDRVDQLAREIRELRGDVEMIGHELEGVKRRQRELYLDVDRRLRELELASVRAGGSGAGDSGPGTPGGGTSPDSQQPAAAGSDTASAAATPPVDETKARKAYEAAFELLKDGRYGDSIREFERFIVEYGASGFADNAQYWLGEANYVSKDFEAAAREFRKVFERYPDSPKVPDAKLKLGFTRYELEQWDRARAILEEVVSQYPDSTAAQLAKTRLQRMRKEGH